MKSRRIFPILVLWLCAFNIANANVRINEIAWMGTTVSGTNEWIELFNEGDTSIDLSAWNLTTLDGSPSIALSGSIAPRGYFLIERTDDTTVPDVVADQVAPFSSGLSNNGETLYLKDGSGVVVDTVIGGSGWVNIGGDNTTKETAQYTSSGWVTGAPTPRTTNISHGAVLGASTTASTDSSTSVPSVNTSSGAAPTMLATPTYPRKDISVFAGDDKNVFMHSAVLFAGTAYGLYDEPLPYATYHWNFGDGAFGEGKDIAHVYDFPGDYIVTLEVFWGNKSKTVRMNVSVIPQGVVIGNTSSGKDGFIEIINHSNKEAELSLWQLRTSNGVVFTIPRNTFISAGQSIRFPNVITSLFDLSSGIEIAYPDGMIVSSSVIASKNDAPLVPVEKVKAFTVQAPRATTFIETTKTTPKENITPIASDAPASVVLWKGNAADNINEAGDVSTFASNKIKWMFLMLSVVLVVLAGFIISRGNGENSIASEYAIIEDIIESRESLDK